MKIIERIPRFQIKVGQREKMRFQSYSVHRTAPLLSACLRSDLSELAGVTQEGHSSAAFFGHCCLECLCFSCYLREFFSIQSLWTVDSKSLNLCSQ